MSKKTCFLIFVLAVVMITVAFILKITLLTEPIRAIFSAMSNPYLAVAAILISLLLYKHKHAAWLLLISAAVCAIVVQVFLGGGGWHLWPILYKTIAFLVYNYLTRLIRFML